MAATYEPIASTTLGSDTTVTFSSIPGDYTDLRLVVKGSGARSATTDSIVLRLNGDTGSNYSFTALRGSGSAASSYRLSSITSLFEETLRIGADTYPLTSILTFDFFSYASTSVYKTCLGTSSQAEDWGVARGVGLWRSTSAITSISLQGYTTANFKAGSTFSLYGIKAA